MGQGPFPLSNLDVIVAIFLMASNTIKWKVILQRLGRLKLCSWFGWGDHGHAASVFLVFFFRSYRCSTGKTQLFRIVFAFCGVLVDIHGEDLF